MSNVLTAAFSYPQRRFSVIPIQPSEKKPLVHWEQYQSGRAAESEIKGWWTKWPDANVGIVTGALSGLVVIDLDTPEAKEKLKGLVPGFDFTAVPRSRTGKGWQLFFKHPGITVPNRAGVIPQPGRSWGWRLCGRAAVSPSERKDLHVGGPDQ